MQEESKNKKSFSQNMKAELKKVIWPTGKQVVKSTFATISFVLLISIILIVLNYVFSFMSQKWYELVVPGEVEQQNEQVLDSNVVNSGDELNTEIISGESNLDVASGDENIITE